MGASIKINCTLNGKSVEGNLQRNLKKLNASVKVDFSCAVMSGQFQTF
jgi:hypothetical protein